MQSHVTAGLKTCSRGEMKGEIRKRSQEGDEAEEGEDSDAQAAGVSGYLPSALLTFILQSILHQDLCSLLSFPLLLLVSP